MKDYQKFILEKNKFSVNRQLPKEYQDFKNAIIKSDLSLLKSVIDKVNTNEMVFSIFEDDDKYLWTALLYMSSEFKKFTTDQLLMAKELINHNANINIQDRNGNTPLIYAAYNANLELINLLIEENATLDIQDNNGSTALHHALDVIDSCKNSQPLISLINAGSDLYIEDNNGESFLYVFDDLKKNCKKYIIDNSKLNLFLDIDKYNL